MPNYVDDPQNPGKKISAIELQKRTPFDVLPPIYILDWLRRDLWSRRQAIQLLAGVCPANNEIDSLSPTAPRHYLDGTSDVTLYHGEAMGLENPPRLEHPTKTSFIGNIIHLKQLMEHCNLDDIKPPSEWIEWADTNGYEPYWKSYAQEHGLVKDVPQSAPAPISTERSSQSKPTLQKISVMQEDTILRIIRDELKQDPTKLKKPKAGTAGTKADVRQLLSIPNPTFQSGKVFDKAWQRLRDNSQICDE